MRLGFLLWELELEADSWSRDKGQQGVTHTFLDFSFDRRLGCLILASFHTHL